MRQIQVKPLSLEGFRYYGNYYNLMDLSDLRVGDVRTNEFYPDLARLNFSHTTATAVSVARVAKCERIINFAEIHRYTSEGILPIDSDCIIYVGKAERNIDPKKIEAFFVPQGTFVALNPGVVHGRQFVSDSDSVNVMIMLPERTYANDCEFVTFEPADQIEII